MLNHEMFVQTCDELAPIDCSEEHLPDDCLMVASCFLSFIAHQYNFASKAIKNQPLDN